MNVAHIMGIPLEESVLQLAPAGGALVTTIAIAGGRGSASYDAGLVFAVRSEDRRLDELRARMAETGLRRRRRSGFGGPSCTLACPGDGYALATCSIT